MEQLLIFIILISAFILYSLSFKFKINHRRKRLKLASFSEEWREFLYKYIYLYRILPEELKLELHEHIKIFIAEKEFISPENLPITMETKDCDRISGLFTITRR